ncbi:sensor histidine kinase [Polluticoccus soli]|uniref:sensor histidine kinase n=1 Tax=Polluticoccus soli TaxID=3034150 RepID=UPI0023E1A9BE|nr:response regulator [Flavipsychrobacter sp. JY13-12]
MEFFEEEIAAVPKPVNKILVVDDREDNLFSIETILDKEDYIITKANSGRAALKILLKEHDFTLILMDVQMPDLNGFETATLIYERDKLKHIPIIFITANDHGEENMFKGYQMGGVDYIYKPINPDLLRAKVSVYVELYNKNHQLMAQEQKLIAANKNLEREILERINSEEKVNRLNKQLMENINQLKVTNEELERFAYVASHDLQEPLRKIIIFGDRLVAKFRDPLGDEGQGLLERMMKASNRMQLLIKNLLAFSRSATNNNDSYQETPLNALLDGVLSDLEIQIEQKQAVFHIGELPTLYIIPGQFRQLFQNLVINALKFSKEDVPPEINIYSEKVKGMYLNDVPNAVMDQDYHRIIVKDNGIGFDQQYAEQIFTVFKRLHSFDEYEGTGIGLSICKKIIDQYNGSISAQSAINEGATFVITLPAAVTEKVPQAVQE